MPDNVSNNAANTVSGNTGTNDTGRTKGPEELELEKQAAMARLRTDITKGQADSQKAIAEASKATAEAQRDLLQPPNVTTLAGNITSDGTFIESRILARKSLGTAVAALGEALKNDPFFQNKTDIRLALYNATDLPVIELYVGLSSQLFTLDKQFEAANTNINQLLDALVAAAATATTVAPEAPDMAKKFDLESLPAIPFTPSLAPAAGLGALGANPITIAYAGQAIIQTVMSLASLFRVNTSYNNFDLPVEDVALAAEFKKAIPIGWKLWHPAMFPANAIGQTESLASAFMSLLEKVLVQYNTAAGLLIKVNDKISQLSIALATETDATKKVALQRQLDQLSACLNALNALNSAFVQLQAMLATVDTATQATPLTTLLRAERLIALLKSGHTYIVKLSAISKGSNKVSQRLWSSAVIRHSAGTELNCLVFSPDGEIVFANTQLNYTPYLKPEEIRVRS
ncbi:hypothetical protein [Puia dinghuensis]|uniref:Uncharacterized protein n=1 Tax=Puia dinghuensis TaxID=1792502 RepID=A0A8J2UJ42_9BACT|nr:hypothetical protein [Puia dinghuensis]GGB23409.1 hypothetical protein GCM10011511_54090 [Puia dinghuensis]